MDEVTQQNAAMVEAAAGASTALHERAERLADLVSVFRLQDAPAQGARAPAARVPAPRVAGRLAA
jgi:methyl-accepting chemotaxis protein